MYRINRVQAALLLHKLPSEIDAMPYNDVEELLGIHRANNELSRMKR